jgi:hypothetical protein
VPVHYLGPFTLKCPSCHAWHWLAEKRSKSTVREPEYAECCRFGEVRIDFLDPLPLEFRPLFDGVGWRGTEFLRNIRRYNKALAFTSTGGSGRILNSSYDGHGPPLYKIQGEIYHRMGPLLPDEQKPPVYSQMYIYDHAEALQYRMGNNRERVESTMRTLQIVLKRDHSFVDVYQQAFELANITELSEYRIQLNFRKGSDRRRYNLPTAAEELALIIPGDENTFANA